MPPPPKMISPICDGVDGVDALLLLLPLLLLVVDAIVVALALYLLLLLAAAVLPGVQGGRPRLRVSTACRRLRSGPEFSPCFGEGKINGKCAIVEAVMPLVLPVTLLLLLLLLLLLPPPNMRSNSLTMESSPSPPPPPLPARKTLS